MWKNTLELVSFNKQRLWTPLLITSCSRANSLTLNNSEDLVSNMYVIVPINRNHYTPKDYQFCMTRILKSTAGFSNILQNHSFQFLESLRIPEQLTIYLMSFFWSTTIFIMKKYYNILSSIYCIQCHHKIFEKIKKRTNGERDSANF